MYCVDLSHGEYSWRKVTGTLGATPSPRIRHSCWVYRNRYENKTTSEQLDIEIYSTVQNLHNILEAPFANNTKVTQPCMLRFILHIRENTSKKAVDSLKQFLEQLMSFTGSSTLADTAAKHSARSTTLKHFCWTRPLG